MTAKVFLKPGVNADGSPLTVLHHITRDPVKAEGEFFDLDRVVYRRIADKDLVKAEPPEPAAAEVVAEEPAAVGDVAEPTDESPAAVSGKARASSTRNRSEA